MMWGAISYARKIQLVHISGNLAPYFVAPSDRCKLMSTSQYCVKVRTFSRRPFLTVCADIPQRPETFDDKRFARNCVLEVDNFGGGSVMMWGAISYARKTQLVHIAGNLSAARYRDEVLRT
jgi:hypothetical protein